MIDVVIHTGLIFFRSFCYRGITLAIIIIACFAKMLPALLLSKVVGKQSWRFCTSVAILMNTRGLVELIALNVALSSVG